MKRTVFLFLLGLIFCVNATGQARTPARGTQTPNSVAKPTPTPAPQKPAATRTPSVPAPAATTAGALNCGCEDKPLPAVIAVVNSVKLTPADLSEQMRSQVQSLQ